MTMTAANLDAVARRRETPCLIFRPLFARRKHFLSAHVDEIIPVRIPPLQYDGMGNRIELKRHQRRAVSHTFC